MWRFLKPVQGFPTRESCRTPGILEIIIIAISNFCKTTYDEHNRLVAKTTPGGGETRSIRNSDGTVLYRLEKMDADNWSAISYTYNGNGQVISYTQPYTVQDPDRPALGKPAAATLIAYDPWGNRTSRTDELGNVTRYEYDEGNLLTAVIDPLGHRTEYAYDGLGRLTSQTDVFGNRTEWQYNLQGRVSAIRGISGTPGCASCALASGVADKPGVYQWTVSGLLQSYTDNENNITRYEYDANRRKIREIDPAGHITVFAYDDEDRLIRTTDPLGNSTHRTYSPTGKLLTSTDALGNVSRNSYDLTGKLAGSTDAAGGETVLIRDAEGRIVATRIKVDATTWRERRSAYNLRGDLRRTIDAYGTDDEVITSFDRDAAGRIISTVIDPDGLAIATGSVYDAAGRLSGSVDARGNSTSYQYDAAGNLTGVVTPEGRKTVFEYDEAGRRIATIADPDGVAQEQSLVYDASGNLTSVSDGVAATNYLYDRIGRRIRIMIPGRSDVFQSYDAAGRLTSITRKNETGAVAMTATREYDATGRLIKVTDEAGQPTSYVYDAAGRLVSVTDALGAVTSLEYDAVGRQTKVVLPHGGERRFSYNLAGELLRNDGGPEGTKEYRYDSLGRQIETIDANGRSRKLAYDKADRVIRMENEMGHPVSYTHDANGNRIALIDANGNTSTYVYDRDNKVVSLTYPAVTGQPENIERYAYDGAGRLVCKTTPNGDNIRVLYNPAGNIAAMYHGDEVDAVDALPASSLIAKYERDGAGEVTVEEDPLTAMLYSYDEFGR